MKSRIIKFFISIFLFLCISTLISTKAYATSPIINGIVQVKGTGAPVVGVWVQWTDNTKHVRYAQTDSNGKFSFASWQAMTQDERNAQYNNMIDTNLDGVNDARMADTTDGIYFGCVQSPHEFTAIIPKNGNYSFTTVTFSYANGGHKITIPPIIENPPTPACGVACTRPSDCQGAKDGCTACVSGVCKTPPPACGVSCSTPADCQSAKDGCTTCTGGKCTAPPPACGVACTKPTDCASAKDGCTACTGGKCIAPSPTPSPVPACGVTCTKPSDCQNAKDGCTACTGGVCKPPLAACGVACSTPADCQSAKDGCTACTGGKCTAPPPACGVTCTKPSDCQNAKDGCTACTGGVCKPPLAACGVACSTPADCQSAKDGCTACTNGVCSAPPAACGVACTKPTDCQNAKDGCTACTGGKCTAPVPACGVACSTPADCQSAKDGCNTCTNGVCAAAPPANTFNPASCTCDGIAYGALFSGQSTVVTAYAKVIGSDVSSAQVTDQKFFLAEGDETQGTIIAKSDPIPASVIANSPSLVRYQSQWQFTLPDLKPNATYRLWSQLDCQPKVNAYNYSPATVSPKKVVLGNSTQQSFFSSLLNFFSNLFGSSNSSSNNTPQSAATPTPNPLNNRTLQLKTLTPAQVIQQTCTFIKFRVSSLK